MQLCGSLEICICCDEAGTLLLKTGLKNRDLRRSIAGLALETEVAFGLGFHWKSGQG